jgi:pyruvate dehydrogenase (quinone)
VIALVGDGAMQMNGLNGLITISRAWREWRDPRLTIMVLNNGDLNQVTWEQRVMEGDPRYVPSQALPAFPYAAYADILGLNAIRVDRPQDIGPAWEQALSSPRPTLLEMVTDPDVPPLPPHISSKQAKAYLSALLHGDSDSLGIIKESAKQTWDSLFPGGK